MLLDAETLDLAQGIERDPRRRPRDVDGPVKPELFQSVLEIATRPCADVAEATAQLADLRRMVSEHRRRPRDADRRRRHPPVRALPRSRRSSTRARYKELVAELGFIATRELIFGTHVHVGIDGARQGDLRRRRDPPLPAAAARALGELALLARARRPGLMSARTPVFRAFPRVGVPPHYGTWEIYSRRVEQMMRGRRDRGLHLPLVGRAAAPEPGDGRDAGLRPADPARGHRRVRRADQSLAHRLAALFDERRAAGRAAVGADRRQQGARRAQRHRGRAGRLRARQARAGAARWSARLLDDARPTTPRSSAAARSSSRVRDDRGGGTGARRQLATMADGGADPRAIVAARSSTLRAAS